MAENAKNQKTNTVKLENINLDRKNMLGENSSFSVTEAYKAARTNFLFLKFDNKCQKIAFTSCYPSEGKTINCANIAISLAQANKKVLVIDCDMRRPRVRHLFELPAHPGISEYLAGIEEKPTIRETKYENLFVITAGKRPPNPAELLSSDRMNEVLNELADQFDYILLDTPPVNVVTDAVVLNKIIHGYVMIVRAGMTQHEEIKAAISKFEQLDAHVIGFVLNDAFTQTGSRYGKYGKYGKYGRYAKYSRYSKYRKYGKYLKYGNNYGAYKYGYGRYGGKYSDYK